jgi:hypothetical protein
VLGSVAKKNQHLVSRICWFVCADSVVDFGCCGAIFSSFMFSGSLLFLTDIARWVYGSFALTFHILSLGAGALLEDHWSWQAVYEWTGFCGEKLGVCFCVGFQRVFLKGLLLMIVGAPSALVLSVVFLNGLLTSGLSRAKSFAVSIGASVFCLAICVISLTVLIRPWKSPVWNCVFPVSLFFFFFFFLLFFFRAFQHPVRVRSAQLLDRWCWLATPCSLSPWLQPPFLQLSDWTVLHPAKSRLTLSAQRLKR